MIETLLSIFYFIIFCFIISKIAFFKEKGIPTNWFIIVFGIKVLVSFFLTLLYTKYYTDRSTADIFKYFDDSQIMFDAIKTNPLDYLKMLLGFDNDTNYFTENYYNNMNHWTRPYFDGLFSDTHIIIRFNAFIRLFSFGHIQVHNVFMNFISLVGLTMIYKAFVPLLKNKVKLLFYILFLVPSILFWGSGLLKESIIFFALGTLFLNLFRVVSQFKIIYFILIIVSIVLIVYTKFYLLIALSVPVLGYLLNHYLSLQKSIYGYLSSFTLFIIAINVSPLISKKINLINQIAIKQQDFSRFVKVEGANSGFLLPDLSDGFSILINIPNALLNTLIRPFLWECNSLFVWLSAIENIAVLSFIIIVLFFRKKMNAAQKNIFYFNLIFVFCLFTLIGLTTPVFGAIMRYKIPGLILLLISLLLIVDLEKIKRIHPILKKNIMTKILTLTLSFLILILVGCSETKQADLIVHNAKIYTVNDLFDIAEAMVITDGKIVAIGPEHEIRNKYNAKEIIDAKKQAIYPGFIDAHCHFVGYALNLKKVNLVGTNSFNEVIKRVVDFSKNNNDEWIVGRGWDQNDWEIKEFPTKEKLDSLFPTRPVFLTRIDGHAAIANSEALRRANINYQTKIAGGAIIAHNNQVVNNQQITFTNKEQATNNHPLLTGVLLDNALELVHNIIPQPNLKVLEEALLIAQHNLFEVGITTVDDAGLSKDTINLIDKLQQEDKLKVKVYAMISGNENMLKYYLKKGPYKTDKLNVRSFKFYADGALGSRGACLIEPYADIIENEHHGLLISEADFFNKYAPLIYEKGFQMNTHCIGDSANRLILDVYAKVLKGVNDKRWRIEHAQVIDPDDFIKFQKYTIIPSIQPTHATSDMYWAKDRLGEERVKGAYAYKDLLNQNGIVALGTDFPVEDISPIKTFYAAIARKDSKGYPKNGYQMENALSRKEALKGMTIWAALSNFEENEKGSLEVGKAADFVMLNNDIMTTSEENILNIKVIQTFINGENVFSLKK